MTEETSALFCPLEFRYGRDEVRAIFSREARLERALRVEGALARTEAELGMIPVGAAEQIEAAIARHAVTLERVDALERELRHDVMAIARALAEASGAGGAYVHFGTTSADITDTALALEHREALAVLREDLTALARALAELARTHRATPEVGRTHGQHAVPLSFGYKMAVGAAEVLRQRARLDELLPRVAVGKISGAVGTGAGFGPHAADVEERTLRHLGLSADEAPGQIVGRDRIAELTNFLALLAGTCERLSTEVRNLQRTEIGEVSEPFDERRQVGSSTMAQKRNPMASENVTSLARLVRAFALPPLENMALWHERDLANSANERVVVPHALLLTDDMLQKLVVIFRGLHVDPARMAENLERTRGTVMTENLMLALTVRGVPRAEAHETLRRLTRPDGEDRPLAERAAADPTLVKHFRPEELGPILDADAYVRAATAKTDRVLSKIESALRS